MSSNTPTLIAIGEAARLLGKSVRTVQIWADKKVLHAHRDERGHRFFALDEILARRPRQSDPHCGNCGCELDEHVGGFTQVGRPLCQPCADELDYEPGPGGWAT